METQPLRFNLLTPKKIPAELTELTDRFARKVI